MAARCSFGRSIGKFGLAAEKPAAIFTAFRGERSPAQNRAANSELESDLQQLNLGYYPVTGMGQEEHRALFGIFRWTVRSSEDSFVVQPRREMLDPAFESAIRILLKEYEQSFAIVKLSSTPEAFLLRSDGLRTLQGSEVGARTPKERYFSQLTGGPRADDTMLDAWELRGERNLGSRIINWLYGRSYMNKPADRSKIGRRFAIRPAEEEG